MITIMKNDIENVKNTKKYHLFLLFVSVTGVILSHRNTFLTVVIHKFCTKKN